MGPKISSFTRKNKKDPTIYSLRAFPIGGFCAIAGEESEVDPLKESESVRLVIENEVVNVIKTPKGSREIFEYEIVMRI